MRHWNILIWSIVAEARKHISAAEGKHWPDSRWRRRSEKRRCSKNASTAFPPPRPIAPIRRRAFSSPRFFFSRRSKLPPLKRRCLAAQLNGPQLLWMERCHNLPGFCRLWPSNLWPSSIFESLSGLETCFVHFNGFSSSRLLVGYCKWDGLDWISEQGSSSLHSTLILNIVAHPPLWFFILPTSEASYIVAHLLIAHLTSESPILLSPLVSI